MTQQLLFCLWLNKNTQICLLIYIFSQVSNKKENMKALRIKKKKMKPTSNRHFVRLMMT